jgi:KamA family protein
MVDLSNIPHIKRWRIHTRLPSVLPSRIDQDLLELLSAFQTEGRQTVIVTHINHPNEVNQDVHRKLLELKSAGLTTFNQSVLLKSINDNSLILRELSEKLFAAGTIPYYLHLLDRTQGTQHFEVEEKMALQILHQLSSELPGYMVPKLVREIEGQPHKVIFGHSR